MVDVLRKKIAPTISRMLKSKSLSLPELLMTLHEVVQPREVELA
jgi:hypothetical protein